MSTLFDILKKDRNGTFQWLETVHNIETAKARVLQLSSGSLDEFVIFRENDLQVVATSTDFFNPSELTEKGRDAVSERASQVMRS